MKKINLFKSINLIRRGSGANLNLFRSVAMVLVLLTLGIGNAWAGHDTHTATLNVNKGTGSGTVYASTSGSATSGSASASSIREPCMPMQLLHRDIRSSAGQPVLPRPLARIILIPKVWHLMCLREIQPKPSMRIS